MIRRVTTLISLVTPAAAAAGIALALGSGCAPPEAFYRNVDGGIVVSGSGGDTGSGGTLVVPGSGGSVGGGSGGVVGSGGSISSGSGGVAGTGGRIGGGSGGGQGTGGAVPGSGGRGTGGSASGGAAGGDSGSGGRATGGGGAGGTSAGSGGSPGTGGAAFCPSCMLTVYYVPTTTTGNSVNFTIDVSANMPVPVNRISVKYWFTNDSGSGALVVEYDEAKVGQTSLTTPLGTPIPNAIQAVAPARVNADSVVTVAFPNNTPIQVTDSADGRMKVQVRFHRADYGGNFTFTNDHSFMAGQTLSMPFMRVTAYIDSRLAWGNEPMAATQ